MSSLKQWFSAAELASLKVIGLPTSKKGMIDYANREGWPSKKREGKGGGTEYQPPKAIIKLIQGDLIDAQLKTSSVEIIKQTNVVTLTKVTELKDWQRNIAEARAAICNEVKRLAVVGGKERAIQTVIELAAAGSLPEHLQKLVSVANAKAGVNRALSRTSLYKWFNDFNGGLAALAPKEREKNEVPAWAGALINLMAQPQKPTLKSCIEDIGQYLPKGVTAPSYFAANRFIKKMGNVEAQRGRMGTREIKSIMPFVRRDTSKMWPTDCYTADGHTFDAEVAHRDHGRPFRPEVTTAVDIATRYVVGWSAGLAESTWTVLDALRDACVNRGLPALFYVDNGSGFKNEMMNDEVVGFMARLEITMTNSLPYGSQSRGLEERSHKTILVKAAKKLPTYMGKDMDPQARQKAFKITRADIKNTGSSSLLLPWVSFVELIEEEVKKYNHKPHRGLPKIRDAITGSLRHQSPAEAWAEAVADGFKPVMVEADEADDLFRPYKEVKVSRGEVRLFNNIYFSQALEQYHGETLRVGFDLHDASRVWVRNQAGQLVCIAEFEANKRNYFPESFIEQAAQRRAQGRIKRAQAKIDEAIEELNPTNLIEHQAGYEIPVMNIDVIESSINSTNVVELPKAKTARPMFETDASKYRWITRNNDQATSEDNAWLRWYRTTSEYEDLFGDLEVAAR